MIANKIKYVADLFLSLVVYGGADKNYKQLPLPIAVIICIIGFLIISLILLAGVILLVKYI